MTDTMIERMAKAVREETSAYPSADGEWMAEGGIVGDEYYHDIARAVLTAMREPSNEIFQAGFDAEAAANPDKTQPHHVVPAIWAAMIDAALAEGQ